MMSHEKGDYFATFSIATEWLIGSEARVKLQAHSDPFSDRINSS